MQEMNDVTQMTPNQGLAVLCEKYGVDPQVVILFCWQSLVFDFVRRGSLDPEIIKNIRDLQAECDEEGEEENKIITATR
jgi:hypothetical protein